MEAVLPETKYGCASRNVGPLVSAAPEVKSIAFPAISCGAYGYPLEEAVQIAVRECSGFAAANPLPEAITFACFDAATLAAYGREISRITG